MTKTGQIVETILQEIAGGRLRAGDRVDSERGLIARFGVSLGTAQRALKELQHLGVLTREHGRGTFVKRTENTVFDARFIRFKTDEGAVLPIHARVVSVRRRKLAGAAHTFFEKGAERAVYITREMDVGGRFKLVSEFVLLEADFDRLSAGGGRGVEGNIRENLAGALVLPSLRVEQSLFPSPIPPPAARLLGLRPATEGICIEMRAYTGQAPLYLQTVWSADFGGARLVIDR